MSAPGDDAQRDMEQRALRNVRALVDKIEDKDALDRKTARKWVIVMVVVLVAVIGAIFVGTNLLGKREPERTLVIPPPAQAPK